MQYLIILSKDTISFMISSDLFFVNSLSLFCILLSESCDLLFLISGQIGKIKLAKSDKFFWPAQTFVHEGYLLLYMTSNTTTCGSKKHTMTSAQKTWTTFSSYQK